VIQTLLAAVVLAVCVLMLARLWLNPAQQARIDGAARRITQAIGRAFVTAYRWPRSRRNAARIADEAIRRAREPHADGTWEGNVYKPKSFKRPHKPH
jgi:hypothetical protein